MKTPSENFLTVMKTPREHFLNAELKRRMSVLVDCAREYDQMVGEFFRHEQKSPPRYDKSDIDDMLTQVQARADDVSSIAERIYTERHRK